MHLRQGACQKALLMHDLTILNASGFCVKIHSRPLEMGCCQNSPLNSCIGKHILFALFFAFFVCEKCMAKRHPYHRSNRSDKEKLSVCKSTRLKIKAFSHAIARIDGKHEHKAKTNRCQPLVLSPIIVFPDQKRQNDRGGREHNPLGSTCLCFRNTSRGKTP